MSMLSRELKKLNEETNNQYHKFEKHEELFMFYKDEIDHTLEFTPIKVLFGDWNHKTGETLYAVEERNGVKGICEENELVTREEAANMVRSEDIEINN